MKDKLTLEWLEEMLEEAPHMGNNPKSARDYALLCVAVNEMRKHDMGHMTREMADKWVHMLPQMVFDHHAAMEMAKARNVPEVMHEAYYAVINALHDDYHHVAKAHGVDRPEFYADMAKAWLMDEDAVNNKACAYWRHIVRHDE